MGNIPGRMAVSDLSLSFSDHFGHACRYEVDKLSSSQRLDLNLEKGRMRDELQALRDKSNEMEIKMDRSALPCSFVTSCALMA